MRAFILIVDKQHDNKKVNQNYLLFWGENCLGFIGARPPRSNIFPDNSLRHSI